VQVVNALAGAGTSTRDPAGTVKSGEM